MIKPLSTFCADVLATLSVRPECLTTASRGEVYRGTGRGARWLDTPRAVHGATRHERGQNVFRRALSFALLLAAPGLALAQALPPPPGDEQPAISVLREDLRDEVREDDSGTTIVGERESPIGLYITPWRNAYSEQDIDRPARLLQVDVTPIDRTVFARQVEYYSALTEAAEAKTAPPVAAPAAP